MVNKISKIVLEKGKIQIEFLQPLENKDKVILWDQETEREQPAKIVDGHAEVYLQSAGSSLGHYEVFMGETKQVIAAEEHIFQELRFNDYFYDWDRDVYMRYFKDEEGRLKIVVSRVRDIVGKQKLQLTSGQSGTGFLNLGIQKELLEGAQDYRLIIVPNKREGMWIPKQKYDSKEEILRMDLGDFLGHVEKLGFVRKKWKVYVEILRQGQYEIYITNGEQIVAKGNKKEEKDFYDRRHDYMDGIYSYTFEEKELAIYPYLTAKGNLALMQIEEKSKYTAKVMNRIKDITPKKNGLLLDLELHPLEGHNVLGVYFYHRTKIEEERDECLYPITIRKKEKDRWTGQCFLDFTEMNIRPLYWDLRLMYEKDGMEYPTLLCNDSKRFQKKYHMSLFPKNLLKLSSGEIFYPYKTIRGNIAFQCRAKGEYDTLGFRLKERLAAFLYFILKPYWINKNIYLVYEKFCVMAQDNGYYFFKYCMENDVEKELNRRIYYIMDPKSPDWEKVAPYKDHVIPFMSLKHMIYLIASKLLISTDTIDHVYAWRPKDSILHQYLDSKKLVFLQHGVIALKQVHFLYSNDKRGRCSIFVTSNNMERDIIYDYFGYKMDQIAVTGLCRWDVLEDKSEGLREILIMPTWRNWLDEVSDEAFKESDYYDNYMRLLNSDWLKEYLEKYDLHLNFYLHPKFREYISNFKMEGERLRLIPFGEEPLNELMMRCKLLVTDYSSVCWDVFYQGKPVIFYQFDAEQYDEAHGSYIDFEKDLFGDRALKPEELMNLLEEYAQNEFALKEKYARMRKDCYKHIDKNNSKRICEEIVKRGW